MKKIELHQTKIGDNYIQIKHLKTGDVICNNDAHLTVIENSYYFDENNKSINSIYFGDNTSTKIDSSLYVRLIVDSNTQRIDKIILEHILELQNLYVIKHVRRDCSKERIKIINLHNKLNSLLNKRKRLYQQTLKEHRLKITNYDFNDYIPKIIKLELANLYIIKLNCPRFSASQSTVARWFKKASKCYSIEYVLDNIKRRKYS